MVSVERCLFWMWSVRGKSSRGCLTFPPRPTGDSSFSRPSANTHCANSSNRTGRVEAFGQCRRRGPRCGQSLLREISGNGLFIEAHRSTFRPSMRATRRRPKKKKESAARFSNSPGTCRPDLDCRCWATRASTCCCLADYSRLRTRRIRPLRESAHNKLYCCVSRTLTGDVPHSSRRAPPIDEIRFTLSPCAYRRNQSAA